MTIKDLQDELKKYDENLEVKVRSFYDPLNRADVEVIRFCDSDYKKDFQYIEII